MGLDLSNSMKMRNRKRGGYRIQVPPLSCIIQAVSMLAQKLAVKCFNGIWRFISLGTVSVRFASMSCVAVKVLDVGKWIEGFKFIFMERGG